MSKGGALGLSESVGVTWIDARLPRGDPGMSRKMLG